MPIIHFARFLREARLKPYIYVRSENNDHRYGYYNQMLIYNTSCPLADKSMQEFPYLAAAGLNPELLTVILTPGSSEQSWQLRQKPKFGFYANLLAYQKESFPELSQRQVGKAIFCVDPWMRESVNDRFPVNAYRKIVRLQNKHTCMDEYFPYFEGKST